MAVRKPRPKRAQAAGDDTSVPEDASLAMLREAAAHCRRCDLWKAATQTVFGEGPEHARIMVVGEQPADQEDLSGRPFVGSSGKLFDRALAELGIDRGALYVTNAVKHFKFERRGEARLHRRPDAREQAACPSGWTPNGSASGLRSSCAWARSRPGPSWAAVSA